MCIETKAGRTSREIQPALQNLITSDNLFSQEVVKTKKQRGCSDTSLVATGLAELIIL